MPVVATFVHMRPAFRYSKLRFVLIFKEGGAAAGGGRIGEGCGSETPSADRHGFNQNGRPPQASV